MPKPFVRNYWKNYKMTDKRTDVNEVPYEALHNANEGFGDDVLGESGKKVLETKLGNKIVDLYEELQNAHIDPVTGLFTVVRWREEMSRYYEIAKRENKIFSVRLKKYPLKLSGYSMNFNIC